MLQRNGASEAVDRSPVTAMMISREPESGGDVVLTLNQSAWIGSRRDVLKPDVGSQTTEQRDALPNEHRHSGDNETLNESRTQEPLDCDPTVHIEMMRAGVSESRRNVRRSPRHVLDNSSIGRGRFDRTAAQNNDALSAVGPGGEACNRLECV